MRIISNPENKPYEPKLFEYSEWKSLNLKRDEGYGYWVKFNKQNKLLFNYNNVFLKPQKDYTHVLWYTKEVIIEMIKLNMFHPAVNLYVDYINYLNKLNELNTFEDLEHYETIATQSDAIKDHNDYVKLMSIPEDKRQRYLNRKNTLFNNKQRHRMKNFLISVGYDENFLDEFGYP